MTDMDEAGRIDGRAYCGALRRQPDEETGERLPCKKPAGWGTKHPGIGRCRLHGGSTHDHAKFAQVEQARRDVALWGGRRDIRPAEALLELVQTKAAEVQYWRMRVAEMPEEDLTYGVTKVKTGGDDYGTTEEAKPALVLTLLHKAEADLATYAAAALKAGCEEARVRIAEQHAAWAIGMVRRAFELAGLEQGRADEVLVQITREVEV